MFTLRYIVRMIGCFTSEIKTIGQKNFAGTLRYGTFLDRDLSVL